jgi:trans-aconitate methyltransferase
MLKNTKDTSTYTAYAAAYDDFKGDRHETIELLKRLIERYHPTAKSVLDLACGTGSIAKGLIGRFDIVGLDNAGAMLDLAKKKLPDMPLVNANMIDFKINQKFDVVYCVHNSVNHLLTLPEWQAMFANVAKHLYKDAIFIFDINTVEKMDRYAHAGIGTTQIGQDYLMTQVTKDTAKSNVYSWDVKIFSKQKRNNFLLHHESIKVSAFPLDQVEEALINSFTLVDSFILDKAEKDEDIGRAYYVGLVNK